MAFKIYVENNHIVVQDLVSDKEFRAASKEALFFKDKVSENTYNTNGFFPEGLQGLKFSDIVDENEIPFVNEQAFIDFFSANTGNFNSAGASAQYSETEQVIGKWIDDKPLYRKVVNFTNPTDTDFVDFDLAEVDFILINGAYVSGGLDKIQIPFFRDSTETGDRIVDIINGKWSDVVGSDGGVRLTTNFFNYTTNEPIYRPGSGYLIFQYTKTTD